MRNQAVTASRFRRNRGGRRRFRPAILLTLLAAVLLAAPAGQSAPAGPGATGDILVLTIDGPITPPAAEYVERGFARGREIGAALVVIELDTPGGLMQAMRSINQEILNAAVPVVVYVSPAGARAASAGAFITLAADVAAMAPGTNIGAAHPVQLMGKADETMTEKSVNDAAAAIRSLAERHGRDGAEAERLVRESISLTESEAVERGLVDLTAHNLDALLEALDGREASHAGVTVTIATAGRKTVRFGMDLRRRILDTLADPNVAYLLLMLGFLGIFFEISSPGAFLPGIVGALALILAFYSLQTIPVSWAGLFLILFAGVLFIAEVKVVSYGLLSLGGIAALFLGSLMLFPSSLPWQHLSLTVLLPVVLLTTACVLAVLFAVVRAHRRRPSTGREGLVGEIGEALEELRPRGQVFVRGEIWEAEANGEIHKGDRVRVTAVAGLRVTVVREKEGG